MHMVFNKSIFHGNRLVKKKKKSTLSSRITVIRRNNTNDGIHF